jgi:hypothetical protein
MRFENTFENISLYYPKATAAINAEAILYGCLHMAVPAPRGDLAAVAFFVSFLAKQKRKDIWQSQKDLLNLFLHKFPQRQYLLNDLAVIAESRHFMLPANFSFAMQPAGKNSFWQSMHFG